MVSMPLFDHINRFEIPESLAFRNQSNSLSLFIIVSVCFILIALSKKINNQAFSFSQLFTSLLSEKSTKQVIRLNSLSSVLLMINYFVSLSVAVYLFSFSGMGWPFTYAIILACVFPVFVFFTEIVALFAVQWLSNERKKIQPVIANTLVGCQISGAYFALLNVFWLVNPQLNHVFVVAFFAVLALKYLFRIIKNSFIVLSNGVPLYYIILYLCTLEILPVLIAYIFIWKNFLN